MVRTSVGQLCSGLALPAAISIVQGHAGLAALAGISCVFFRGTVCLRAGSDLPAGGGQGIGVAMARLLTPAALLTRDVAGEALRH